MKNRLLLLCTILVFVGACTNPTQSSVGVPRSTASTQGQGTFNPNAYYTLTNLADGKLVDNLGGTANGTPVGQWSSSGSNNQQWKIIASDTGYFRVIAVTGGLALDTGGNTGNGSSMQQWGLGSSYNQQWSLQLQSSGYYKLFNRTTGLCLDTGGLTANGSALQQWGSGGSNNQLWTISLKSTNGNNNPALFGAYGDPDIHVFNGKYYIYPTTDGYAGWNSTTFSCFSSSDLVNWTNNGVILNLANVSWTTHNYAWAPSVIQVGSTYYMYYCANSNIGVAKSSSPTGPFTDALGHALITQQQYFAANTIDPCVFKDPVSGKYYLYYGNTHCVVVQLNSDMISLAGAPAEITPTNFQEASNVVYRNGKYYLMYSLNGTTSTNYQVQYATSTSPTGPFTHIGTVLSKSGSIVCTGSSSVLNIPGTDNWYIAYHRFIIPGGDGYHREVAIDRLYFNSDGTIAPVVPTLAGITAAP